MPVTPSDSLKPKFFSLLQEGISKETLRSDILAGIIVGIVALPLSLAFAIASGVSPEKGILTAIIAGFLISFFGGSRVQIGGPTGAFIVIVYGIVQTHGLAGLTTATLMAGLMMMVIALFRLGNLLKFFPLPLVVGFTSGIAVIIFTSQIKDFLGLPLHQLPNDFFNKWMMYIQHFGHIQWKIALIGVLAVLISTQFFRITTKIPGSLMAIIVTSLLTFFLDLKIPTIGTNFEVIPSLFQVPALEIPSYQTIKNLIPSAFAIALLGIIESLLSAMVADGMIGTRHRPNAEIMAQGIANTAVGLLGGIPATGALARTATNIRNGGRTPIAGMVHAFTLLLITLLLFPLVKHIPMACLAGILMVVAFNMSEWRHFLSLLKAHRLDVLVLLSTFFLTVIFDLVIAIEVGVVLASIAVMSRLSHSLKIEGHSSTPVNTLMSTDLAPEELVMNTPPGLQIFEINGPLFFGVAQSFQDTLSSIHPTPKVIILRLRYVPFIDATGLYRFMEILKTYQQKKIKVLLSGVNPEVKSQLERAHVYQWLKEEDIFSQFPLALKKAQQILHK